MFNENWSIVNEEFTPAITETISTVATATFNGLFSVVPYENIFDLDWENNVRGKIKILNLLDIKIWRNLFTA